MTTQRLEEKLKILRKDVEQIDRNILRSLQRRFICTDQIQHIKKTLGISLSVPDREQKLLMTYCDIAKKYAISKSMVRRIFQMVFSFSKQKK